MTISGLQNEGMQEIWSIVQRHREQLGNSGELQQKRQQQQQAWFSTMLEDGLKEHFMARADVRARLPELEQALAERKVTPTQAARQLLELLDEPHAPVDRVASRRGKKA